MTGVNVQIERTDRENNLSVLRRFRNRVRSSGVLIKARSLRYHTRAQSEFQKKQSKLRRLTKAQERERLIKLGKIGDE
jgi:hypothetical protein